MVKVYALEKWTSFGICKISQSINISLSPTLADSNSEGDKQALFNACYVPSQQVSNYVSSAWHFDSLHKWRSLNLANKRRLLSASSNDTGH